MMALCLLLKQNVSTHNMRSEHKYRQYMELIPILLFCLNAAQYFLFFATYVTSIVYLTGDFHETLRHFLESSLFASIIPLFYIKRIDRWYGLPNLCLWGLVALWVNNFPYIVLKYEAGDYFVISTFIIYAVVLIFALMILTNRITGNAKI